MPKGLDLFLQKISENPVNNTYIQRFISLVKDESVGVRIDFYLRLSKILFQENPLGALNAANLGLQDSKVAQNMPMEAAFLELINRCFSALGREEKSQLTQEVRETLLGLQKVTLPPPTNQKVRDKSISTKTEPVEFSEEIKFPKPGGKLETLKVEPSEIVSPAEAEKAIGGSDSQDPWLVILGRISDGATTAMVDAVDSRWHEDLFDDCELILRKYKQEKNSQTLAALETFVFEKLGLTGAKSLFEIGGVEASLLSAWSHYLNALITAKPPRDALSIVIKLIRESNQVLFQEEAYKSLKELWHKLGLRGFHWDPVDGSDTFLQNIKRRPLPKASSILIS